MELDFCVIEGHVSLYAGCIAFSGIGVIPHCIIKLLSCREFNIVIVGIALAYIATVSFVGIAD